MIFFRRINFFSRIVERNRPVTVLTVYTGDPDHKVALLFLCLL